MIQARTFIPREMAPTLRDHLLNFVPMRQNTACATGGNPLPSRKRRMQTSKNRTPRLSAAKEPSLAPSRIVVMGVTGCGKTTVASEIAAKIGARFCDGDALHSLESVAKMQRGEPLDDDDRWPWFARIACFLNGEPTHAVIACSALKKAYRDYLRREVRGVRFLFLDAPRDVITRRVSSRQGHYMPVSLVTSQFAALERPENEDRVTTVSADTPVANIVRTFLAELSATHDTPAGNDQSNER